MKWSTESHKTPEMMQNHSKSLVTQIPSLNKQVGAAAEPQNMVFPMPTLRTQVTWSNKCHEMANACTIACLAAFARPPKTWAGERGSPLDRDPSIPRSRSGLRPEAKSGRAPASESLVVFRALARLRMSSCDRPRPRPSPCQTLDCQPF